MSALVIAPEMSIGTGLLTLSAGPLVANPQHSWASIAKIGVCHELHVHHAR